MENDFLKRESRESDIGYDYEEDADFLDEIFEDEED